MAMYVLYEHAAGYGLFSVKEFEEIGMLLPQVEASVLDLSRFNAIVKLVGFHPFKTAMAALNNVNAISEGLLPDDLSAFLDTTLPKSSKKKVTLGVADAKLGAAISEALEVQCSHIGAVPEILRGIRHHFVNMVKGFTDQSAGVAQLGLGHSYSRCKVKFNVHRSDNMIIQSIALLDQLDKDVNTFSMRIREWYSYHFPELVKIVNDNYLFAKVAHFIKDRKSLTQESLVGLEEIVMDAEKAQSIIDAAKMSMGMDISVIDLLNIEMFAMRVVRLSDYRQELAAYLGSKMNSVAPNLQALIGDQVGARLISKAGSLTNLAKFPASTVQILGAEKALFRALKTKSNTPKYGLLFNSAFISRATLKNKGRISRFLANKCTIASRIDCFTETPTQVFGEALKQQVEDRLKFYESGTVPRKNLDVMKEALEVVQTEAAQSKKKKKNKRALEDTNGSAAAEANGNGVDGPQKKKKKKKFNDTNGEDAADESVLNDSSAVADVSNGELKKKKKKKNKNGTAEA
ncbi:nucleolar protein 56 [Anopheles ziemanni]|uniref:nucleolar protein 56 n=1 Tax=Anopheles coustani TaxID=139045 RepID=UPI00265A82EE|nr:nucleolar protein 56 [Anopheles coustani]XP_058174158.1 nucleolar protein 56 [Anopheles ziemanni]